jgi:hypothetical protein
MQEDILLSCITDLQNQLEYYKESAAIWRLCYIQEVRKTIIQTSPLAKKASEYRERFRQLQSTYDLLDGEIIY